jgi:hypothetical protein
VSSTSKGRYSRRRFLQLSGIALLSTQIQFPLFTVSRQKVYQGRALEAAPVHLEKDLLSLTSRQLWPDSIVPIYESDEHWYQVPDGYVQRHLIQPMTPYEPGINQGSSVPFWAEVAAPVAPVRQWCAADAPLITRIGHGGVARVIDWLPGDGEDRIWYGLETGDGNLLGWTQAVYWHQVNEDEPPAATHPTLHIDQRAQRLTAYEQDQIVLQALISSGVEIVPGRYSVEERRFSGVPLPIAEYRRTFYGIPWYIRFGKDYVLSGAYWHNRFGAPTLGPAVQAPPFLARWLYYWLGDAGTVTIT